MTTTETAEIAALRLHEKDTGSADVQVATLTKRITDLTEHLKGNAKDHSSRRGLLKMVATRRRLLDYLKDTASERYQAVIEKLNLRKYKDFQRPAFPTGLMTRLRRSGCR